MNDGEQKSLSVDEDESLEWNRTAEALSLEILDRIGCGGAVMDATGTCVAANAALFEVLGLERSRVIRAPRSLTCRLRQFQRSVSVQSRESGVGWIQWESGHGRPIIIAPLRAPEPASSTVLVFIDVHGAMKPRAGTLSRMFGLTGAEVKLANEIAAGFVPGEIAERLHVSTATIRSQLASIFAKTQTNRQSELVALLARVSLLK